MRSSRPIVGSVPRRHDSRRSSVSPNRSSSGSPKPTGPARQRRSREPIGAAHPGEGVPRLTSGFRAAGVLVLPSGAQVRGRPLDAAACQADFALVLSAGPMPPWPYRRVRWPDFGIPLSTRDALEAIHEAHERCSARERVEACCAGGVGRTGTVLAALAVLDGLPAGAAVAWVRARYHPRAVEMPWQRAWLRQVR